jgi:hypothetical protein
MTTLSNAAELRRRALAILVRELGYVDAMRFLLQYELGLGDYSHDRDRLCPDWSDEEILRRADEIASKAMGSRPL